MDDLFSRRDILKHLIKRYNTSLYAASDLIRPLTKDCSDCDKCRPVDDFWCNHHLYMLIEQAIKDGFDFGDSKPYLELIMPQVDIEYLEDYVLGIV